MSRTHRRHSYRRSRRWNPGHDADFVKHLKDGGRVEVWMDGEVCVFDAMDRDMDDYHLKPHEVPRFIRELKEAKPFAAWHHYEKDSVKHDGFEMQGRGKRNPVFMNPRGHRGHRGHRRKNRRHRRVFETTSAHGGRFRYRRGRIKVPKASYRGGYIHGRRNPYKVDYYMDREIRGAKKAKRMGRRRARGGMSRAGSRRGMLAVLGQMNPRRGRGRAFGRRGGLRSAPSIRDWQGFQRIRGLMKGNPKGHRGHRKGKRQYSNRYDVKLRPKQKLRGHNRRSKRSYRYHFWGRR